MKLFLIKIGKAWSVLRRDGLQSGSKRVFRAFFGLFRRVHPGDVLFISNGIGDSARYRTRYRAEELELCGLKTAITVQDNPFLSKYADRFSVFIFHRVLYTPRVAKLIDRIKAQNKEIIFETDDLVYDPAFLKHMDYYTQMNALERTLYEHGVGGEILADPYVKVCTTSTAYLAERLRERGKRVFVVRNKVSQADVRLAGEVLKDIKKNAMCVRVGYLSGTPSHNKDFATIVPALTRLLVAYPEMRLVLVGPLDIDERLDTFGDRIERLPFLSREKYFSEMARLDINLAPLEIGNPFCEAKSELKWFEAGLLAVPTVAAATKTFRQAITDGVDGFVAATEEEWEANIGALVADGELRKRMGAQARETVLARYTTTATDEDFAGYLKQTIKRNV